MATILKINNVDYSGNVIAGTYSVNTIDKYNEWEDGFGNTHRDQRRNKIEGSFDMFFKTEAQYQQFLADLNGARHSSEKNYTIQLKSNNERTSSLQTIAAFINFTPKRNVGIGWSDFFEKFTVSVKES